MNVRDKAIIEDIERFRVLNRDVIADLHFPNVKNKIKCSNYVLKRLRRDGHIVCSQERRQFVYFPADKHIKKDSTKIPHFLMIAEFYRDLCAIEKPTKFIVEPRYAKGMMEPDVFMIWKGAPWHVEIQRTAYSAKQMQEKITRYDQYYLSNDWQREEWQRADRKTFPYLWICGVGKYNIGVRSYRVYQASMEDMIKLTSNKKQ